MFIATITFQTNLYGQTAMQESFSGYTIAREGAWCWFADPRALHYENASGSINSTYIGYIDIHGHIKATQHDFITGKTYEVSIRSYFQPDDHNNPTFLVLPDERIMIFYSRHTDEACFYYRISKEPGDIRSLGKEIRLNTANNTTYPSPFILKDDPEHIYLCWRGIAWHPTIGQLSMPNQNDSCSFTWGPYQMVQSTGARPYAKYTSNGKDKIYFTYTTAHPDNQQPNYIYANYIDINHLQLKDIQGNLLSNIADGPFRVAANHDYTVAYPTTVVDNANMRDWVWQIALDREEKPVIAMVRINSDKSKHDYYYAQWTGSEWRKTFLCHAGGHFHQTPTTERCYSGGMAIDTEQPNEIYCSLPIDGKNGKVYEIVKYTIDKDGQVSDSIQITKNSAKNNSRPYIIPQSADSPLRLIWMNGDYYYWIVSSRFPKAYATSIRSLWELPEKDTAMFTIHDLHLPTIEGDEEIFRSTDFVYGVDFNTKKPYILIGNQRYDSDNILGSSDVWQHFNSGTNGKWPAPELYKSFQLGFRDENGILRSYVNGLIDQSIKK